MDDWNNDLFDRYYKSWWGIDFAYSKIAAGCGVTTNAMTVLTLLYKHRTPMTQNELSKDLYLPKQTVTGVLDTLEKRGLVTRSIDPNDRRSRVITLTEEGRSEGRRIGREMRRIELAAIGVLSDEEKTALVDIMEKLWHSMSHVLGDE